VFAEDEQIEDSFETHWWAWNQMLVDRDPHHVVKMKRGAPEMQYQTCRV
jgi:hypothetical protein